MSDDKLLRDFASSVLAEVIDNSKADEDGIGEYKENVFTNYMLEQLSEYGVLNGGNVCFCEKKTPKGWIKANGWSIEDDDGLIELFITLYSGTGELWTVPKREIDQALAKVTRLFEQAATGYHKGLEFASDKYGMLRDINDNFKSDFNIRFYLFTDGIIRNPEIYKKSKNDNNYKFDIWDIQRIFRCVSSGLPYEPNIVQFEELMGRPLPCLGMNNSQDEYKVYLAILPGQILYKLYEEYGSRLLELNVRSFLQARGKVNKGIRKTLKEEPHRFLAYNNGICCTAEQIKWAQGTNGELAISSINGLQVVNGGQTMASIHRAKREDGVDLKHVSVQAKITIVDPSKLDQIVPSITRYANSQNKVNEADFSSNDPYHVELQRISERTWTSGEQSRWFYERARGQYQVAKARAGKPGSAANKRFAETCPPRQKITKTDVGKYLTSWDRLPHLVSLGPQKNFTKFIIRLRTEYDDKWLPDVDYYKNLIGKAILYKTAEKVVRSMKEYIPAYRSLVVAYTVSYLSFRAVDRIDFIEIWDNQDVSDAILNTIEDWCTDIYSAIITSAEQRNIGEWCKKLDCWNYIRGLNLDIPADLKEELEAETPLPNVGRFTYNKKKQPSEKDKEYIAKVMLVDADTYYNIHKWGFLSGELKDWQYGIALTLSGYALGGWREVPSVKQARQAVKFLKIACERMPGEELPNNLKELF